MSGPDLSVCVLDAGTVYAEGVYSGLRLALQILAASSVCVVPSGLRVKVKEWECNVIHREWLAGQGRPVPFAQSSESLSFIHAVIHAAGLELPHHVQ